MEELCEMALGAPAGSEHAGDASRTDRPALELEKGAGPPAVSRTGEATSSLARALRSPMGHPLLALQHPPPADPSLLIARLFESGPSSPFSRTPKTTSSAPLWI